MRSRAVVSSKQGAPFGLYRVSNNKVPVGGLNQAGRLALKENRAQGPRRPCHASLARISRRLRAVPMRRRYAICRSCTTQNTDPLGEDRLSLPRLGGRTRDANAPLAQSSGTWRKPPDQGSAPARVRHRDVIREAALRLHSVPPEDLAWPVLRCGLQDGTTITIGTAGTPAHECTHATVPAASCTSGSWCRRCMRRLRRLAWRRR